MANRFEPTDTLLSVTSGTGASSHVRVRAAGSPPPASPNDTGTRTRAREVKDGSAAPIALPLGLAFVGGALGGIVGGGAMAVDIQIAFSASPIWIKALAILAVTWTAIALFIFALWRVNAGLDGASHREGKNRPAR
ncbi:hypothetical protein LZC95_37705 [Pendulispora brunnea]|uniref:Uncharacterized protein n=1 Tax=Pendulispora brunnea TaxID=2905690 RepID=A0ABZ2K0B0_9BACT